MAKGRRNKVLKLTPAKVKYIIRAKTNNIRSRIIAAEMKVSINPQRAKFRSKTPRKDNRAQIWQTYTAQIPHNSIQQVLLENGLAIENKKEETQEALD